MIYELIASDSNGAVDTTLYATRKDAQNAMQDTYRIITENNPVRITESFCHEETAQITYDNDTQDFWIIQPIEDKLLQEKANLYKDRINACIDYINTGRNTKDTLEILIRLGFDEETLKEFDFSENDIQEAFHDYDDNCDDD